MRAPVHPRQFKMAATNMQTVALGLVISAIVVSFLYVGREILVPLALASLLSFVLWPLIKLLRRARVGRTGSVLAAVILAIAGIAGLGAVMALQVSDLANELPGYEANLRAKVRAFKGAAAPSGAIGKAADAIEGLQQEFKRDDKSTTTSGDPASLPPAINRTPVEPTSQGLPAGTQDRPVIVELHESPPSALHNFREFAGPLLSPLTTLALVILFLVFILMQREDLRDRVLRLAGGGDLQRSTLAMNDAGERLSRYFLIQLALNVCFGIVIGVGLALIGVPSPILWGILAGLMRFVPYVGSFIAAAFPLALAAAVDPTWTMFFATIALFLLTEPIAGQVVEPMLYGKNTGLSPVAVVVSTLFWALMWGPVGLLLATPITVCLVVLGKHVPALNFLDVILGDEPALTPEQRLYQRLLIGDAGEAVVVAEEDIGALGLKRYYSDVAMKALSMAHLDAVRGRLQREAQQEILDTLDDVVFDLVDYPLDAPIIAAGKTEKKPQTKLAATADVPSGVAQVPKQLQVLCIATRSALDEAAAQLQSRLLLLHGINAQVISRAQALEIGDELLREGAIVSLSYFGLSSPLHARTLVRRIRQKTPNAKIVAGFWLLGEDPSKVTDWQTSIGADYSTSSLSNSVDLCLMALAIDSDESPLALTADVA